MLVSVSSNSRYESHLLNMGSQSQTLTQRHGKEIRSTLLCLRWPTKRGNYFLKHCPQLCNGPQFRSWWFSQHWKVGSQFSVISQQYSFMHYSSQEKKYKSINRTISRFKTIMFSSCVAVSIVSVKPHAIFLSTSQNVLFIKGLHLRSMIRACSLALLWF